MGNWYREKCTCERCNGEGMLDYDYDDFDTMTAKEKLGYLKFEEPAAYAKMTKEDKKIYIQKGIYPCPICDGEGYEYIVEEEDF